jgi:DNA-directed RNA polymerase subunit omega
MLDIDIEDALVKKVGGKFKLTSLMQKRMVELNRGFPPLVEVEMQDSRGTTREIACQEILQGKIELAPRDAVGYTLEEDKRRIETERSPENEEVKTEDMEIYGSDIKKIKEQRIKELSQLLNPKK